MSAWGNTDAANSKPKWVLEKQNHLTVRLFTANSTANAANTITFTYYDGGASNVANVGVANGQVVFAANLASGGIAGMFRSNNTVLGISGNNVTFASNTFGTIPANTVVEFDYLLPWKPNTISNTYNSNTILVTNSRAANIVSNTGTIANLGSVSSGWVRFQKKTNSDGTVRYLRETLVALANSVASNTNSGNTSFGQVVAGL